MARIFGFRWAPADKGEERQCLGFWDKIAPARTWVKLIDRRGVLFHYVSEPHEPAPILFDDEQGGVFGPLFRADAPECGRVQAIGAKDVAALVLSEAERLVQDYWGAYVAIVHDRGNDLLHIVRDPAGSSAIFAGPAGAKATAIFTHASDYIAAIGATADEAYLGAFLIHPRLVTPRTALCGVEEVMAGERLTLGRSSRRNTLIWRPSAASGVGTGSDFGRAADTLRQTAIACAADWAHGQREIIHRLSGGLDSTVALAALCRGGAPAIRCVNLFAAGAPEGDERPFARGAARHFGVPLAEIEMAPANVDYRRLTEIEFEAKPSRTDLSFADLTLANAIGRSRAGLLVTSGQGGDQIFHRSRSPLIAADAVADGLPLSALAQIAFDTARLGRRPISDIVRGMILHGLLRSTPRQNLARLTALADEVDLEPYLAAHPMAQGIEHSTPARAARIGHILDLQHYYKREVISARFHALPILASQPLIEFCLNVAPYVMTQGGRDRALARAAFGAFLPEVILNRSAKGTTTRYHAAVLERQLPFMREVLLGGELERRGLLRKTALHRALSRNVVPEAAMSAALSTALVAELWLSRCC